MSQNITQDNMKLKLNKRTFDTTGSIAHKFCSVMISDIFVFLAKSH